MRVANSDRWVTDDSNVSAVDAIASGAVAGQRAGGDLLHDILSGEPAIAAIAQEDLDRLRLAAEARSQKFRELRIAERVQAHKQRLQRRQAFWAAVFRWSTAGSRATLVLAALVFVV